MLHVIPIGAMILTNPTDDAAVPFNTQFFHDEDDDDFGGTQMFEDIFDADGNTLAASSGDPNSLGPGGVGADGDVDLLAEGLNDGRRRRVRPEFVSYAKRAKRVDVRRLKENIWKGLGITVDHGDKSKDPDAMVISDCPSVLHLHDTNKIVSYRKPTTRRPKKKRKKRLTPLKLACSAASFLASDPLTLGRRWKRSAPASVSSACCTWPMNRG